MEKPLISFIITYYNEPLDLLCECIDSITVLTLTSDEREIIVVDDGSDESPVETLKQFGDAITYIRQKHMGLSEARNRGLQMATGEYIQFIDADDAINIHPYVHCLNTLKAKSPEMIVFDFCSATTPIGDYKFNDQPSQSGSHYMRHNNTKAVATTCATTIFTVRHVDICSNVLFWATCASLPAFITKTRSSPPCYCLEPRT